MQKSQKKRTIFKVGEHLLYIVGTTISGNWAENKYVVHEYFTDMFSIDTFANCQICCLIMLGCNYITYKVIVILSTYDSVS